VRSEGVLGGRKVAIRRPRARTAEGEVPLPTFQTMAKTDPLDRRVVEQMLVGVATRRYARSLEPLDAPMESRGTSKSTVSRRFVARTQAQLETWQARPLDDLAVAVLLLDGVHVGDHCLIVALGITEDGTKHALGLWEGSTENSTVCQSLLANLQSRGLRTDRSLLVILDGSKALRKAVRDMFATPQGTFSLFNLFNANSILQEIYTYGASWLQPNLILQGRLVKFGAQLDL